MRNIVHLPARLLVAAFALCIWAGVADAQTVSNGPYYATPSWDQTLASPTRFVVLSNFNSDAVLDRETGLVWERAPSTTPFAGGPPANTFGGGNAAEHCIALILGNRKGWRVPAISEILSLVDPSQSSPALPPGHPFTILSRTYWSSTEYRNQVQTAFRDVTFISGQGGSAGAAALNFVWCVRGGAGEDIN